MDFYFFKESLVVPLTFIYRFPVCSFTDSLSPPFLPFCLLWVCFAPFPVALRQAFGLLIGAFSSASTACPTAPSHLRGPCISKVLGICMFGPAWRAILETGTKRCLEETVKLSTSSHPPPSAAQRCRWTWLSSQGLRSEPAVTLARPIRRARGSAVCCSHPKVIRKCTPLLPSLPVR